MLEQFDRKNNSTGFFIKVRVIEEYYCDGFQFI